MSYSRILRLGTLASALWVAGGCARWTVWPESAGPASAAPGSAEQSLLALRGRPAPARQRPESSQPGGDLPAQAASGAVQPQSIPEDLKNLDPSLAIARLSERQGEAEQARRLYKAYLERNPRHPLPHHRLGVMAARSARFEEAEQHFQAAMKLGSPSIELLCDLGYLYYLQDRLDEAEQVLLQACQADPNHQAACNNLALVYAGQGDFEKSMRYFRRVNDDAEAHANVAFMLAQHGRLEHSRSAYLRALSLDNSLRNAAKALLQVEQTRKQRELAQQRQEQLQAQPVPPSASEDPLILANNQGRSPHGSVATAGAMTQPGGVQPLARISAPAAPQASRRPAPAPHPAEAMLMPVPRPSDNFRPQPAAPPVQLAGAQAPLTGGQAAETADYEQPLDGWLERQRRAVAQALYDAPTASAGGAQPARTQDEVRPAAHWERTFAPGQPQWPAQPLPLMRSSPVRIGLSDAASEAPLTSGPATTSTSNGPVRMSLNDAP